VRGKPRETESRGDTFSPIDGKEKEMRQGELGEGKEGQLGTNPETPDITSKPGRDCEANCNRYCKEGKGGGCSDDGRGRGRPSKLPRSSRTRYKYTTVAWLKSGQAHSVPIS